MSGSKIIGAGGGLQQCWPDAVQVNPHGGLQLDPKKEKGNTCWTLQRE
jgi:hypothetical protein